VREVAQSAVAPGDLVAGGADAQAADAPAVYRVRVALDAPPAGSGAAAIDPLAWRRALKAGMHVQASLVGEKRTLVEWAIEPLAALRVAAR
jgi:membrane fusion protein